MFKSEEICKECRAELISLLEPQYGLCDDCIEDWRTRRDLTRNLQNEGK